ncbi:MAG TPA: hypothetical protein VGO67_08185 [Verrucomicrobiae bacterium]|jgi:capsular polysaccharide biosynthesis protein
MPDYNDPRSVRVSVGIYERLLTTYPAAFRKEYGQSMKQLFRDQCRDAWNESGRVGMVFLWLRVLADWARTLVVEHLSNLNERKFSFMNALRSFTANPRLRAPFLRVFLIVIIPAIACSLLVVFASPRIYSSTVRLETHPFKFAGSPSSPDPASANPVAASDPYFMITQIKIIESWHILTSVITDMHLNKILPGQLGKKPWTIDETYTYLAKMVNAEQTPMTGLIEINVKNESPILAANIANKIAYWYKEDKKNQWRELRNSSDIKLMPDSDFVVVRDPARPGRKPIFPNPRIITISILGGTLLALIAGGIAALFGMISRASPQRRIS